MKKRTKKTVPNDYRPSPSNSLRLYYLELKQGRDENLFRQMAIMRQLRSEAESGDAQSQFLLGVMYDIGYCVRKNAAEAQEWYRKAAQQGHFEAKYWLDTMAT